MIRNHPSQPAFTGGEMSPLILGRHDLERFLLGGTRVENFIARHQGPLVRRRGTQWIRSSECAGGRLVNFERTCSDAEMLQIGCGEILVGATIPGTPPLSVIAEFSQYDMEGVAFPAHAFKVVNELGETLFFLSAYVSGSMVVKYSITPNNPALSEACEINTDVLFAYVYGLGEFTFDGGYQMYWDDATPRDPDTGDPLGTGGLHMNVVRKGRCGAYNTHTNTPGTTTDHYADTWEGLMVQTPSPFSASGPVSYWLNEQYVQKYYSEETTGYFVGSDITTFQSCPGYEIDYRYTDIVTLDTMEVAVARTGTAARTQALTGYDDGTRVYTGTHSKVNFTVFTDPTKTKVSSTLVFTVTPDVGDPYTLTRIKDYDVTGASTAIEVEYPWIVDATVTLTSWEFSHTLSVYDDSEEGVDGEEMTLVPAGPTWDWPGRFMCPAPNGGCHDDFEDADTTLDPLITITGGYGWAGSGFFIAKDPSNAYDDFDTQTAGEITTGLNGGTGWASYGFLYAYNYLTAYDDFETGVAGTVFTVTGGTNWADDGFFIS